MRSKMKMKMKGFLHYVLLLLCHLLFVVTTGETPKSLIEDQVSSLLSRMTLQEKIGQMTQVDRSVATPDVLRDFFIGSVLNGGGSSPAPNATPLMWADMVDGFQKSALSTRLGIPVLYGTDAVHGHNNVVGATIFPHNVGLGAARDENLMVRIGKATAIEVRGTGIPYTFAPCIAVCRDPRWGRCYESYSEDTEIVRSMSKIILGLQGSPPRNHTKGYPYVGRGMRSVVGSAKHYAGDGGTDGGVNEYNTIASYNDLFKIHMRPYIDVIAMGVSTIMVSYSSWNGVKMHANPYLINQVLKQEMGFQGFVISDWEGVDRISSPPGLYYKESVKAAVNAGIDMVMVPYNYNRFITDLMDLVVSGEVPMSRIDDAVTRILRVKFISGLFQRPMADRTLLRMVGHKKHRELAREAVRKSLVLLKNGKDKKKPMLPLSKNAERILVAGTHANDIGYQCGGWTITWEGTPGNTTTVIEPYIGLMEGLVAAWLPGSEAGKGIADVIFGDYDFKGKLPRTWFRRVDQLPMNYGDPHYDPLFPLGYGLNTNVSSRKKPARSRVISSSSTSQSALSA
ncbi:hypothetical protein GIB67_005242 [Kingdonia uniflora]|uniref:Beta-glucosidase n=1 Tax=Kingdonia uniflora TaxID=39325 RepID=A0A7J7NNM6_9MAGN|nr:hypothetical protein GIB67_005242 [Kingdonia uniflora]